MPGVTVVAKAHRSRWKSIFGKIKQWLYSWMRPGYVESTEEYKISKLILLQFICSAVVLEAVEGKVYIVTAILRFLQGHVFVHESLYLHYLRAKIRHFDVSHGSQHEVIEIAFNRHFVHSFQLLTPLDSVVTVVHVSGN